jgi:hypothetical protein
MHRLTGHRNRLAVVMLVPDVLAQRSAPLTLEFVCQEVPEVASG